jgi:hypothetical protein
MQKNPLAKPASIQLSHFSLASKGAANVSDQPRRARSIRLNGTDIFAGR